MSEVSFLTKIRLEIAIAFTCQFTLTTDTFFCFTQFLFRWFFIITADFHFTKCSVTLHLLFQNAQCLFNIVVMNDNRNYGTRPLSISLIVKICAFITYLKTNCKKKKKKTLLKSDFFNLRSFLFILLQKRLLNKRVNRPRQCVLAPWCRDYG